MDFLGSDPTLAAVINNDTIFSALLNTVNAAAVTQTVYATYDMRQEMRGIADGAKKRLAGLGLSAGSVSYERVVLMNLAFDVILSYVYPIIVNDYLSADQKASLDTEALVQSLHMCDGFVAAPSATATGGSLMSRSFMNHGRDRLPLADHGVCAVERLQVHPPSTSRASWARPRP